MSHLILHCEFQSAAVKLFEARRQYIKIHRKVVCNRLQVVARILWSRAQVAKTTTNLQGENILP